MVSCSTPSARPSSPSSDRSGTRRRWWVPFGTLLAALALLGVTTPPSADLVTVVGAASATLPPRAVAATSMVVTVTDGVDADELGARVVRVRQGTTELPLGDAPVTVRFEPSVPAVVLETGPDALTEVAAYEVLVAVEHTDGRRQLLTFTLTRDTAVLTAPTTVMVERTLGLGPTGALAAALGVTSTQSAPRLHVEVSSTSRVVELRARQLEAATDPEVTVTVPDGALPVGPGGVVAIPYEVLGEEPGTQTRTVRLSSPQLTAPVDVVFTVTTRRSPVLLGLALVVGALLGALVRTLLPRWSRRLAAERARADLIAQLEALLAANGDATFRTATTAALAAVRAARGVSAVERTVESTTTTVAALLGVLDERLTARGTEYDALHDALRPREHLPAAVAEAVGVVVGRLDEVRHALDARDADRAQEGLAAADDAVPGLLDTLRTWTRDATAAVDGATTLLGSRSAGSTAGLVRRFATLQEALMVSPVADGAAGRTASVDAHLDAVERATGYLPSVQGQLALVAEEARAVAEVVGAVEPAARVPLLAAAEALDHHARPPVVDASRALERIADGLAALQDALRAVLLHGRRTPAASRQDIEARLVRGDVLGAAQVWAAGTPGDHRLGDGGHGAPVGPAEGAETPVALETPAPAAAAHLRPTRIPLSTRLRGIPAQAVLTVAGIGLGVVHLVVALALVLLTGYALFLTDWVGTYADMATALTWAFAVDLSLAGLAAVLSLPAPAPRALVPADPGAG